MFWNYDVRFLMAVSNASKIHGSLLKIDITAALLIYLIEGVILYRI